MVTRKSRITQEIRNGLPSWTKTRADDQSVGSSFINSLALGMEDLDTEIFRGLKNQFLTTAFVGEIDNLYTVSLPNYFSFTPTTEDTLQEGISDITVSGLDGIWYELEEIKTGTTRDFWYEALPTRLELIETYSVESLLIASGLSNTLTLDIIASGLLLDNRVTVIADGESLLEIEENGDLKKGKVKLTGETWKETAEQEDVNFLFSESKKSFKAWNTIDLIEPIDFPEESLIHVYSHAFNQDYYLDSFDSISQFEESRENMPFFWTLDVTASGFSTLTMQKYSTGKALDLIKTKPEIVDYKSWALLDTLGNPVLILDIKPLPYLQQIVGVSSDTLYIWDSFEEIPNLKEHQGSTGSALIDLSFLQDFCLPGGDVEVNLLFVRPTKTIIKHKLSIEYPDGSVYWIAVDGTLSGTEAWIVNTISEKIVRPSFLVATDDPGQYIFRFSAMYLDGTTETVIKSILALSKTPLVELDISNISTDIIGIDIDHVNRWLLLTGSNEVKHILPHYDVYLKDVEGKQLIFREAYTNIKVLGGVIG